MQALFDFFYRYYSKNESQVRAEITNKTVAIEHFFAIFSSSAFFILPNITLSGYLRANNKDDIACVVFELKYVMSTSSWKTIEVVSHSTQNELGSILLPHFYVW